jgi:hypothetical protein
MDPTNTIVALLFAAGVLLLAFILLILVLCQDYREESRESKYRQMRTAQTESNE